jgi:hypothetical protein
MASMVGFFARTRPGVAVSVDWLACCFLRIASAIATSAAVRIFVFKADKSLPASYP